MTTRTRDHYLPEIADRTSGEPSTDRQTLIDALNRDLAREYQSILMYILYSAKLTGRHREAFRGLFQSEIDDERKHAQFLADKIVYYGGDPTTEAADVVQADSPRDMLEAVLEAERIALVEYNERIRQADAFGDTGLRTQLEDIVGDETEHFEEVELILRNWDKDDH